MPKLLARELTWLARPSPGFQLFHSDQSEEQKSPDVRYDGPLRKIAHRGTEVFVAVSRELRWSELSQLKTAGEVYERSHGAYGAEDEDEEPDKRYRVSYCSL